MNAINQTDDFVPLKWIKYEMLAIWDLRNENDLKSTIHRYNIEEYDRCIQNIDNELRVFDQKFVYIIKLIYRNSVYKLPNFLIRSRKDLMICRNKLKNVNQKKFVEIWYCKNIAQEQKEIIYGRMLFSLDELFPRIVTRKMEIVWGDSARLIEQYPNLECAFATVEINGWGKTFRIIDIIQADKSKREIRETLAMILELFSGYQNRIINFGKFINECGCSLLCIEFSYINNENFTIIDWDSDDDMKAINKISLGAGTFAVL